VFNLSPWVRIFICAKPIDMRRSFDGLFELVQSMIHQDAYSGHLFLFKSRRGNFVKALWWDVDGWAIFAKRLEVGTFHFPGVRFVDGKYETSKSTAASCSCFSKALIQTDHAFRAIFSVWSQPLAFPTCKNNSAIQF
jgi:transposase